MFSGDIKRDQWHEMGQQSVKIVTIGMMLVPPA